MKRLAFIVGNSEYVNWSRLKNASNDAISMSEKLANLNFDVRTFVNQNKGQFLQCIDDFGRALDNYDTGLFFYAGHGVAINNENYFIPIDAETSNSRLIESSSINISSLLNWILNYEDNTNIIILDSCRSNIILEGDRGSTISGFSNIYASKGTLISYSTGPNSTASDGTGRNGLYTEILLKHIDAPGLRIEDVFKNVRVDVSRQSKGRQTPWEHSSLVGDFYFVEPQHSINNRKIPPIAIFHYSENKFNEYEKIYSTDEAEAMVFIETSKHFNISLIDVFIGYSIGQNSKYSKFSDSNLVVLAIERFKAIGFKEKNHRWYYEGNPLRIGEILPLPQESEIMLPEFGKEIDVAININGEFNGIEYEFFGECNLPDAMNLMISVKNEQQKYWAQDSCRVSGGCFATNGFTDRGSKLKPGQYLVEISSPIYDVQPDEAKPFLGNRSRNITGHNVEFSVIGGNMIKFSKTIEI